MNKLYKILLILIVGLSACNPMTDIYNQLDKEVQPPKATFTYTLTDADYAQISDWALANAANAADSAAANSIASTNALPEGYAATYVPAIIKAMYPALGKGSTANITYNFNNGYKTVVVGQYKLTDADYQSMGGAVAVYKYFSPSNPPEDYVPNLLSTKYPDATDGTYKAVTYDYSSTDPAFGEVTVLDAEFKSTGTLEDFDSINVVGPDQSWEATSYGAKMAGYSGGAHENEDWLVSPAIDLTNYTDAKLQLNQAVNYLNGQWDQIQVVISTDYTGNKADLASATWTAVTIDTLPSGSSWSFVTSEKVDISAYDGKTIYVALKYLSSNSNAATWEVDWLKVYGTIPSSTINTPAASAETSIYKLSGSTWAVDGDAYLLTADDYNSMGNPGPGRYDNFSSSDSPDNYLPQFLSIKFPYAQDGDKKIVVYKYYAGGGVTEVRADEYDFTNGAWVKFSYSQVKTDQFVAVSDHWIFDPTVTFTMTSSDYQLIVEAVKADPDKKWLVSYGNSEFYYGASSYYNNFDIRLVKRTTGDFAQADYEGLSDAEANALIMKRVGEGIIVMLKAKYPSAVAQVSGIDVMYVVSFAAYQNDGSTGSYTATFQCIKSGPNPDFKLVDGPNKN